MHSLKNLNNGMTLTVMGMEITSVVISSLITSTKNLLNGVMKTVMGLGIISRLERINQMIVRL